MSIPRQLIIETEQTNNYNKTEMNEYIAILIRCYFLDLQLNSIKCDAKYSFNPYKLISYLSDIRP